MITGINHVGIVVKNIDETLDFLAKTCNAKETIRKEINEMGQISSIVQIGDSNFELMQSTNENSVPGRFLAKNGEGLHHISLLSDDITNDCELMKQNGVKIVSEAVLDGVKYVFTHPKTTMGMVCEITEKPAK